MQTITLTLTREQARELAAILHAAGNLSTRLYGASGFAYQIEDLLAEPPVTLDYLATPQSNEASYE